jgi:hypothetical protein
MLFEQEISVQLKQLGFLPIAEKPFVYIKPRKFTENLLFVSRFGEKGRFLHVKFGIRNISSEKFSITCVLKFAGEPYRQVGLRFKQDTCSMQFEVGEVAGWPNRHAIDTLNNDSQQISQKVLGDVRRYILPYFDQTETAEGYLDLLLEQKWPFQWSRTNGALRFAQSVFVSRSIGKDIRENLDPRICREIKISLPCDIDPIQYVEQVFFYCQTAHAT